MQAGSWACRQPGLSSFLSLCLTFIHFSVCQVHQEKTKGKAMKRNPSIQIFTMNQSTIWVYCWTIFLAQFLLAIQLLFSLYITLIFCTRKHSLKSDFEELTYTFPNINQINTSSVKINGHFLIVNLCLRESQFLN
jgi:hypothetical protein